MHHLFTTPSVVGDLAAQPTVLDRPASASVEGGQVGSAPPALGSRPAVLTPRAPAAATSDACSDET